MERQPKGKQWVISSAVAAFCLACLVVSGSLAGRAALLLALAVLALALTAVLHSGGWDDALARRLAGRPWRDGREVLSLALRHLPEVFIVTPKGSLLAPSAVELRMNPADVRSLAEVIDIPVVNTFATEAYVSEITSHSAQVLPDARVEVTVVEDPAVPIGRYRVRQERITPARMWPAAVKSNGDPVQNPLLRLITRGDVTETRISGASAGRTQAADLLLPNEATVSRIHARFTCIDEVWRIASLGRNGVLVNESPLSGREQHVVNDGDVIRWGRQSDALVSKVEIVR